MAQAAVAAQVHQAFDVHLRLATQVTLDLVAAVEDLADLLDVVLVEAVRDLGQLDLSAGADVARALGSDAVDALKRDPHMLPSGKVYAGDTCHDSSSSALPLLVTGVLTKDAHHT